MSSLKSTELKMNGMIKKIFTTIFPSRIDNTYYGNKIPLYLFGVISIGSAVRSCIHMFAPDGGASSIAGMNLSVPGADGIIFAFALWGSSQLLFAFVQLLVVFRYRAMLPLMYLMLAFEVLLRKLVFIQKPVTFAHTPPGAVGNQVILPLALLMLAWLLWNAIKQDGKTA